MKTFTKMTKLEALAYNAKDPDGNCAIRYINDNGKVKVKLFIDRVANERADKEALALEIMGDFGVYQMDDEEPSYELEARLTLSNTPQVLHFDGADYDWGYYSGVLSRDDDRNEAGVKP